MFTCECVCVHVSVRVHVTIDAILRCMLPMLHEVINGAIYALPFNTYVRLKT